MTNNLKVLDLIVHPEHEGVLTVIGTGIGAVDVADATGDVFMVDVEGSLKVGSVKPKSKYELLKMYVVVDNSAPKGLASNGASHASYFAGESFRELPLQKVWREKSTRNVTCAGSSVDIQTAIQLAVEHGIEHVVFEEPDWKNANGRPLAVAFAARYSFPELFSTFPLFLSDLR